MSKTEHFYLRSSACVDSDKQPALEAIRWVINYLKTNKLIDTTIWCVFETKPQITSSEFSAAIDYILSQGAVSPGTSISSTNGHFKTRHYKIINYPSAVEFC